jgi:hypothetical protein
MGSGVPEARESGVEEGYLGISCRDRGDLMPRPALVVIVAVGTLACSSALSTQRPQLPLPPPSDARPATHADEPALRPTDADWDWYFDHKERALEALMPLKEGPVILGYRSFHDNAYSVIERYFGINPVGRSW